MSKKLIITLALIIILITPINAEDCEIFSDNFDTPNQDNWIPQNLSLWEFKDSAYISKVTNFFATSSTANIDDLDNFILSLDVTPLQEDYFSVSIRSSTNSKISFYSSDNKIFLTPITDINLPNTNLPYIISKGNTYKIKIEAKDSSIKAKIWPLDDSAKEPDWMLTLIENNILLGKVSLDGKNTKFDNLRITKLECETPPEPNQGCSKDIFKQKDFIELKGNCLLLNSNKQGFYRFIYTYDENNNQKIIEPTDCGSYTCSFPSIIELPTNVKKIAVYNNEIAGWLERNVQ